MRIWSPLRCTRNSFLHTFAFMYGWIGGPVCLDRKSAGWWLEDQWGQKCRQDGEPGFDSWLRYSISTHLDPLLICSFLVKILLCQSFETWSPEFWAMASTAGASRQQFSRASFWNLQIRKSATVFTISVDHLQKPAGWEETGKADRRDGCHGKVQVRQLRRIYSSSAQRESHLVRICSRPRNGKFLGKPMTICDTLFVHCLHCYLTWFEVGETNIGSAMVARASRKIEQPLETTEPKTP